MYTAVKIPCCPPWSTVYGNSSGKAGSLYRSGDYGDNGNCRVGADTSRSGRHSNSLAKGPSDSKVKDFQQVAGEKAIWGHIQVASSNYLLIVYSATIVMHTISAWYACDCGSVNACVSVCIFNWVQSSDESFKFWYLPKLVTVHSLIAYPTWTQYYDKATDVSSVTQWLQCMDSYLVWYTETPISI